jgi:hypothetical protein
MRLLLAISLLTLAGCSTTTTSRMDVVDLNHFQIDCKYRDEQIAFLQGQIPTENDRWKSAFRITGPVGAVTALIDGTYHEERATLDRRQEYIAKGIIRTISNWCPVLTAQPQGCVTVTEQLPSGNGQGTKCYRGSNPIPVVNRWEAIVDR